MLSLTSALLLTCLMVFGVRAILLPAAAPSRIENNWRLFSGAGDGSAGAAGGITTDGAVGIPESVASASNSAVGELPDRLTVPAVYELFGAALVIVFAVVLLVAATVALLQFLRAFFSRIFPDVLGPDVLGVPLTRGPQLFSVDPWNRQVLHEFREDLAGLKITEPRYGPSLREELTSSSTSDPQPAWRSLWRRTDYLGFPVYSYRDKGNPIDRGASETDPNGYLWKVATHSGYQFTLQYRVALDEVIETLEP